MSFAGLVCCSSSPTLRVVSIAGRAALAVLSRSPSIASRPLSFTPQSPSSKEIKSLSPSSREKRFVVSSPEEEKERKKTDDQGEKIDKHGGDAKVQVERKDSQGVFGL